MRFIVMLDLIKLKKQLISMRRRTQSLIEETSELTLALTTEIPDIAYINTNAENAENLEEAITCYIDYGEYGIKNLMQEIEEALKSQILQL